MNRAVDMPDVFALPFNLGDVVLIDNDESIRATVICLSFNHCGWNVEVAWMANGDHKEAWIAPWRLSLSAGQQPEPDYEKLKPSKEYLG